MKISDFKFSDDDVKKDMVRNLNLYNKIDHCLNYFVNHLPVNKLKKDGSFNFSNLNVDEGKNYDWFFLNNETTTILVRHFGNHFTFFTKALGKGNADWEKKWNSRISVFTIEDDTDFIPLHLNDDYCNDSFKSISNFLPSLVKLVESHDVSRTWNNLVFPREKFTKIILGLDGKESVSSLDTLIFACDELFNKYISVQAVNEVLEEIK